MKEHLVNKLTFCDELKTLFKVHGKFFKLEKGEQLYYSYELNNDIFYFLLSGSMKLIIKQGNKEMFLYHLTTPEISIINGYIPLTINDLDYALICTENSVFMTISSANIIEWSATYEKLRDHIIFSTHFNFNNLSNSLLDYISKPSDKRIFDYLVLKSTLLKTNNIEISLKEISMDLNLSRETVSRLLKKLEIKKKIIKKDKSILILKAI